MAERSGGKSVGILPGLRPCGVPSGAYQPPGFMRLYDVLRADFSRRNMGKSARKSGGRIVKALTQWYN